MDYVGFSHGDQDGGKLASEKKSITVPSMEGGLLMNNTLKQHARTLRLSGLLESLELRLHEAEANRVPHVRGHFLAPGRPGPEPANKSCPDSKPRYTGILHIPVERQTMIRTYRKFVRR